MIRFRVLIDRHFLRRALSRVPGLLILVSAFAACGSTAAPSPTPTAVPSLVPNVEPTSAPTPAPTTAPTLAPTVVPTSVPTVAPANTSTPQLRGGALATFEVENERFKAWVTNPKTIQDLIDLKQGKSAASIPNGRMLKGSGDANHNAPYNWHLDPQDIQMAESTIEVCDGRPSYVQEHVDEFVDVVKRYCPWGAKLVEVQDLR